ncbi:MAG: magnesium-translocating P-type ATPase, partial [Clostridiales bacterium]|nr:magnesium-translocating P-type ATPase [Clostridiales bacterium]
MKRNSSVSNTLKELSQTDSGEIYKKLNIPENGLNDLQVEQSIEKYGRNIIEKSPKNSVLFRLARAFVTPFSVILFVLAIISLITDMLNHSEFERNIITVFIMFIMIILSGIIRFTQEIRAMKISNELIKLVNTNVTVIRNGKACKIPAADIVVGDEIQLNAGDKVPADIRLTQTKDFFVSQSVITGESSIIEKKASVLKAVPKSINGYENIAFQGAAVTGGIARGIVFAVGSNTVYGGFSPSDEERKNGFDKGSNSIAYVFIKFTAVLVPIVFVVNGLTKGNWITALLFSLSVAVGLTPEMLPMVINACLANGSYKMKSKETIVKNINAMQRFGSMDILCVDKTGTLTNDTVLLEYYMDILGNESKKTLDYAFLNSVYHTGLTNHLDSAILKFSEIPSLSGRFKELKSKYKKTDEMPFDYNRKCSSILVEMNGCNTIILKGGIDDVIKRCKYIEYKGKKMEAKSDLKADAHKITDEMINDGMKVLAVAYKESNNNSISPSDERDMILLGFLAFFDAPKSSAESAIKKLKDLNVKIKMLTGDQKGVSASIGKRLGMNANNIITGAEFDLLSENDAAKTAESVDIFSELSPSQKSEIIKILQENGHTVGFLGDGLNDLPAIIRADAGICVDTAAEAVNESADAVLMKKDLNVLEAGIKEGRKAFSNMSKYIKITASSNFGNICSIVI